MWRRGLTLTIFVERHVVLGRPTRKPQSFGLTGMLLDEALMLFNRNLRPGRSTWPLYHPAPLVLWLAAAARRN